MKKNSLLCAAILLTCMACSNSEPDQTDTNTGAVTEAETPENEVSPVQKGSFVAYIENKKMVFTDYHYYDHTGVEGERIRYQIGGNGPGNSEIGIAVHNIAVGKYALTDIYQKEINTVSLGTKKGDGTDTYLAGTAGSTGFIKITKSANNLISGSFAGNGVTEVKDDGTMVRADFHGEFTDIPLLKTN